MQEHYEVHPDQADTNVVVPALNWRSKLSQLTPRVAEHMIANGSGLVKRKHTHPHSK
jgi:hypothetical protein